MISAQKLRPPWRLLIALAVLILAGAVLDRYADGHNGAVCFTYGTPLVVFLILPAIFAFAVVWFGTELLALALRRLSDHRLAAMTLAFILVTGAYLLIGLATFATSSNRSDVMAHSALVQVPLWAVGPLVLDTPGHEGPSVPGHGNWLANCGQ